ncbi:hypothetical protein [Polymorphospora sp. NPDC050346]|uniref:hypothetical protein n=1 Tax=Polymorphospora sp. NPDC050346 TaxID=3155780 RepID=UPI0033C00585
MRLLRIVLVTLLAAPLVAVGGQPAAAHGGKVTLEVAGDGGAGVTIQARYEDGHPVDNGMRLVLNGTGEGGRMVGPVQVGPSNEGLGFYRVGSLLSPGDWEITVDTPPPNPTRVTTSVRARVPQEAPPGAAGPAAADAGEGAGMRWWLVGGAAVVVAGAVGLAVVNRRRLVPVRARR